MSLGLQTDLFGLFLKLELVVDLAKAVMELLDSSISFGLRALDGAVRIPRLVSSHLFLVIEA